MINIALKKRKFSKIKIQQTSITKTTHTRHIFPKETLDSKGTLNRLVYDGIPTKRNDTIQTKHKKQGFKKDS